jgi:GntR family transcriptional repressor for pyruvate dehydrogenase complex
MQKAVRRKISTEEIPFMDDGCMKVGEKSLVARAARRLSALSLEVEDGAFLGAENDLLGKLGVSRPTLRQAAKIAESEHMIKVRRGTRGGFYATRPDVTASIRSLNRYLRMKGVTVRDLTVVGPVSEDAAGFASRCLDEALRSRLSELSKALDEVQGPRAFMDFDIALLALLADMSGNPVIEVLIAMSYSFGLEEQGVYLYATTAQEAAARDFFHGIIQAVLDRDEELARFMMRRRLKTIETWIEHAVPMLPDDRKFEFLNRRAV